MKLFLFGLAMIFSMQGFSQKIKGEIKDESGKAVGSATAFLYKADSALVKINMSNNSGEYEFASIKPGNYFIKISNVGYANAASQKFNYSTADINIPAIVLTKSVGNLKEVAVTAKKPPIEVKADKVIFNVESSITATGLDGMELLMQSPGVLVDQDDNISIAGKSGVKIFIDGKPAPLTAKDLSGYLRSLRSTSIEAIEIITNPSAKYEAEGTGGVINIRLKKNKTYGTNGSVNYDFQQAIWAKHNAGFTLNHRNKNINAFVNYNYTKAINEFDLDVYRNLLDSIFDAYSKTISNSKAHNIKTGVDYFLSKKSTLGFIVTGNFYDEHVLANNFSFIKYAKTNKTDRLLVADNVIAGSRNNLSLNLNYHYSDPAGHDLNMDADYGSFKLRSNQYQPNIFYDSAKANILSQRNYRMITPSDINIYSFKTDYEQNFLKGRLGFGIKLSVINSDNVFDFFNVDGNNKMQYDSVLSNHFIYKENINAAYTQYNRSLKNFQFQFGVRAEQTNTTGESKGFTKNPANQFLVYNAVFKRTLFDLFPSGAITLTKNPKSQWTFSYSRRINRPSYQDLNPFEKRGSEYGGFKGNPNLRPEYANTFSIINVFNSKLITNLSYSRTKDVIASISDTLNGTKSFYAPKNLATQNNISLSENYSYSKKWYSFSGSLTAYYTKNSANFGPGRIVDVNVYALRLSAQHNFTLGKGWSANTSGFYSSPSIFRGTMKTHALYGVNAGIQKLLLKDNGTLRLSFTDIFNSMYWYGTSNFAGQYLNARVYFEPRKFIVSFNYRFGSSTVKAAKQRKTSIDEESKRTESSGQ